MRTPVRNERFTLPTDRKESPMRVTWCAIVLMTIGCVFLWTSSAHSQIRDDFGEVPFPHAAQWDYSTDTVPPRRDLDGSS